MLASNIPVKFTYTFASGAGGTYTRSVPPTTADPAAASQLLGFPPETFVPTASGGVDPDGRDFNGILNQITAWNQWQQAGAPIIYDSVFQGAIGGYPAGSIVQSATTPGKYWNSTADNNASNPDTGGAGWTGWQFGSGLTAAVTSITAGTGLQGGVITSTGTISLFQASTSQLGGVKVDGTSITISGGGVISATPGGAGTLTSVGLAMPGIFTVSGSPVTGASGTLTAALATQAASTFWAGPTSGGATAPTFRPIASNDLPAATSSQRGAVQVDGTTTTMAGSVISAVAVTSVNTGTGLTGGPVTGVGTISMANMAAQSVKANITGSVAPPVDVALQTFINQFFTGTAAANDGVLNHVGLIYLPNGRMVQFGTTTMTHAVSVTFSPAFTAVPWLLVNGVGNAYYVGGGSNTDGWYWGRPTLSNTGFTFTGGDESNDTYDGGSPVYVTWLAIGAS